MTPPRRKTLRTVAIAAALVFHGIAAVPWGHGLDQAMLDSPRGQEELGRWVARLGGLGVATSIPDLGARVLQAGQGVQALRRLGGQPTRHLFRITGTGQGWAYFAYPNSYPHRLVIEARVGDTWTLRYRGLDAEHAWRAPQLTYRRLRGLTNPSNNERPPTWDSFTRWIAAELLAEDPAVDAVRVSQVRTHTVHPDRAPDPREKTRFRRTIRREPTP